MPELAEAHTMADEMSVIKNHTILSIAIYSESEDKFSNMSLTKGQKVRNTFAVGKHVIFELENGFVYSTLSMTGKWLLNSEHLDTYTDYIKLRIGYGRKKGHLNIIKGYIYFIDSRTWGSVKYMSEEEYDDTINKLGPDPLNGELTLDYWIQAITKKSIWRRHVCDFLNDQSIIAGIGNYLRACIMYDAKVFPFKPISELTEDEIHKLYYSLLKITELAYKHGGLSISDNVGNYVTPSGKMGMFPSNVYNRTLCPNGHTVEKYKKNAGSQTVHYCPIEQV